MKIQPYVSRLVLNESAIPTSGRNFSTPPPMLPTCMQPRVIELLTDMGLEPSMMRNNEGCIVLQPADLQAYMER